MSDTPTPPSLDGQMWQAACDQFSHAAASHARVRRGWTRSQWIEDAESLMGDLDGSVLDLVNGHVMAMLDEIRDAAAANGEGPWPFHLQRGEDVTGVSGEGRVADGVLWSDGTVTIHWRGEHASYVHWPRGLESVDKVHGHDGRTVVVWHGPGPRRSGEVA